MTVSIDYNNKPDAVSKLTGFFGVGKKQANKGHYNGHTYTVCQTVQERQMVTLHLNPKPFPHHSNKVHRYYPL